ncbi:MAG: cysteine--tRNA ligase [Candidatus Edwardsbacteria bacterium]|nr:cysteine--tRNA ligase [Candidatus Edwardsbacteria bacterium]
MDIKFYNTLTRKKEIFKPITPGQAGLYTCGPTVYDCAHIGNLRSYVFEDVLRRALEYNGIRVKHVMNITDVGHLESDADSGEDKMEKGSRRTGKSAWEIAEEYTRAFKSDLAELNNLEPHIWCKATDHIPEQIEMIRCIEAKGFTYRTSDGIYFDSSKLKGYGALTRQAAGELMAGARIEMGEKRNPTDFALWKFSPADKQRQMEWESPWGKGFPGWHIECSAMSAKYLGTLFDIHCGGEDHIAVHHNNEIAQTEAAYGTRLANYWMHCFFLLMGEDKMAKSSGEFIRLKTVVDKGYAPLAYRYFCLMGHYRSQLRFFWESLTGAQRALENLQSEVKKLRNDPTTSTSSVQALSPSPRGEDADGVVEAAKQKFLGAVNDDLNMPQALAVVWDLLKAEDVSAKGKLELIRDFDRVLGLKLLESSKQDDVPQEIVALIEKRQQARKEKQWAESDRLRAEIASHGFMVEDTPKGQTVRKKKFGE